MSSIYRFTYVAQGYKEVHCVFIDILVSPLNAEIYACKNVMKEIIIGRKLIPWKHNLVITKRDYNKSRYI